MDPGDKVDWSLYDFRAPLVGTPNPADAKLSEEMDPELQFAMEMEPSEFYAAVAAAESPPQPVPAAAPQPTTLERKQKLAEDLAKLKYLLALKQEMEAKAALAAAQQPPAAAPNVESATQDAAAAISAAAVEAAASMLPARSKKRAEPASVEVVPRPPKRPPRVGCRLESAPSRHTAVFRGWQRNIAPPNAEALETFVQWRVNLSDLVRATLKDKPARTCFSQIRVNSSSLINKGTYAQVMRVMLPSVPFPVAAKVATILEPDSDQTILEEKMAEVTAMVHLNELVSLGVCPHFPLLYETFLCLPREGRDQGEMTLFQELASGTIHEWMSTRRTKVELYHAIFQLFLSIVTYQSLLGIVNNDIKADNVLFSTIQKRTLFKYQVYGKTFCVTTDVLFMVADWGLVTGDLVSVDHDLPPTFVTESNLVALPSWHDKAAWDSRNYGKHPLAYRVNKLPALHFKRDYLALVYMLLNVRPDVQPDMPRDFLVMVAKTVDANKTLNTPSAHRNLLFEVFSERFISTFDPSLGKMFWPESQPADPESTHTFTVDDQILVPRETRKVVDHNARRNLPTLKC